MTSTKLIFVYNADSGLFNTLTDIAHKLLSPQTYKCNLCAITHTALGMREEWKQFVENLPLPVEFLHKDELEQQYHLKSADLPAVYLASDAAELTLFITPEQINGCVQLEDLKQLIRDQLQSHLAHAK
ncbi:MAG: hypothetical protein D6814_00615 [Calditrichaeota bacterium]|nr:MAG: hypothetical protein D6814_00615 [Calditrichota bacterium]